VPWPFRPDFGRRPGASGVSDALAAGRAPSEKSPTMTSSGPAPELEHQGSESSDWTRHRVTDPQRESGIPPARPHHPSERTVVDDADDRVQLALAESTRTEANLGSLLRGLQHLAAGATAARDANLALFHELDTVRELLAKSNAEERVLRQKLRLLEQAQERQRRDAARDRASFIEQEDLFLAELLSDHDREVAELREELGRTAAAERVSAVVSPVSNPPSTLASMKLRTIRIPLPAPTLEHDLESAERLSPPRPSSRPPLKRKMDPSTRPLVEYSLGKSEVREEHLGAASVNDRARHGR
jgi:hypothetical protein